MTHLQIPLSPHTEALLRARAEAEGKDVVQFALDALCEKLAHENGDPRTTAVEQSAAWARFLDAMRTHAARRPPGYVADDDRASLYGDDPG